MGPRGEQGGTGRGDREMVVTFWLARRNFSFRVISSLAQVFRYGVYSLGF